MSESGHGKDVSTTQYPPTTLDTNQRDRCQKLLQLSFLSVKISCQSTVTPVNIADMAGLFIWQ